jgi:hypothetical protein
MTLIFSDCQRFAIPLRQRSSKRGVVDDISHEPGMKTHALVRKPRTRAVLLITGSL